MVEKLLPVLKIVYSKSFMLNVFHKNELEDTSNPRANYLEPFKAKKKENNWPLACKTCKVVNKYEIPNDANIIRSNFAASIKTYTITNYMHKDGS